MKKVPFQLQKLSIRKTTISALTPANTAAIKGGVNTDIICSGGNVCSLLQCHTGVICTIVATATATTKTEV